MNTGTRPKSSVRPAAEARSGWGVIGAWGDRGADGPSQECRIVRRSMVAYFLGLGVAADRSIRTPASGRSCQQRNGRQTLAWINNNGSIDSR
jgi:hypothetical protein